MSVVTSHSRQSQTAATDELIIRDAHESDLRAIIDIYNATVPTRMVTAELEPTTVEARLPWFREHSPDQHPFWVAESDGCVIGWLDFKKFLPRCAYRGTAEISVYVHEKFRRRGVARRLLEEAVARAPSLGITALVGLIFGHNEPSLKLFEQFGFERWGLLPQIARLDGVARDLIVMGKHCPERCSHGPAGRPVWVEATLNLNAPQARGYNDCLDLMRTLMQYRQEPIHSALQKIRDKYSMLHLDVLILIYHFAKICSGTILEIGAFVGGATIATAFGVRDSGQPKKLIAIEPGGSVKHKRLGTRNIFRDLERNLARQRVSEMITLIKGRSFDPDTISAVNGVLGSDEIGLLILDADAGKRRDIECYRHKLADGCWMIIDDYSGADSNAKSAPSRADVDALVSAGALEPLGFYGWSTWVGRWRGNAAGRSKF
jgi:L-amino acid N-acyltransferase YncA/predicted O-methyltransferase YrrM